MHEFFICKDKFVLKIRLKKKLICPHFNFINNKRQKKTNKNFLIKKRSLPLHRNLKTYSVMIRKNINILAIIAFLTIGFVSYAGNEHHADNEKTSSERVDENKNDEKYSPTPTIMHHISDANEFHLWGETSIPLPVILYSKEKGLTTGMSSMFHHGEVAVDGYVMDHGRIKMIKGESFTGEKEVEVHEHNGHHTYFIDGKELELERAGFYDFSITKVVFTMLMTAVIMLLIFITIANRYKKQNAKEAPTGIQNFFEPLILFVKDEIAVPNMGEERANKFMPFLLSIFFFIWILNLVGQIPFIPFGSNVTGNIAFTLVLALFTLIVTNINGNKNYWKHLLDPLGDSMPMIGKLAIYVILVPIELIGIFLKPITLTIRLFANITAGHIIVLSLVSLIFVFGNAGQSTGGSAVGAGIAIPFTLFISLIELLVAFIQAFVFTMLSAMYIGMATEEHAAH